MSRDRIIRLTTSIYWNPLASVYLCLCVSGSVCRCVSLLYLCLCVSACPQFWECLCVSVCFRLSVSSFHWWVFYSTWLVSAWVSVCFRLTQFVCGCIWLWVCMCKYFGGTQAEKVQHGAATLSVSLPISGFTQLSYSHTQKYTIIQIEKIS